MILFLSYVRSTIATAFNIVFTITFCVLVILLGLFNLQSAATSLIRFWSHVIMLSYGITLKARGADLLPSEGGGIIVFNHQSHFDIPAMMSTTSKNIRFGAKIELFKIPFFGGAMRRVGTLPIARENRNEVLKIYKEAEVRLKENTLFVLAPEGTRQKEPALGRFKKGPFIFAVNAQVPIVPCIIRGAHAVLPKNAWGVNIGAWSRTIEIEYLAPISTKGMKAEDVPLLLERTRSAMAAIYEKA